MGTASSLSAPAPDLIVTVGGQRMLFCATDGDVIVGRDAAGVGLQLDHPAVSRVHVRLTPGPRWQIFDYESRNGIYIEGYRVYEGFLTDGMTVRFGAPEGLTVGFHYAVDDRDRMRRIGRASQAAAQTWAYRNARCGRKPALTGQLPTRFSQGAVGRAPRPATRSRVCCHGRRGHWQRSPRANPPKTSPMCSAKPCGMTF